jgi:hypothetical protein
MLQHSHGVISTLYGDIGFMCELPSRYDMYLHFIQLIVMSTKVISGLII